MKNFKKAIVALLAMVMVVGTLTVTASAATVVNVTVSGEGATTMAAGESNKLYFHSWGGYETGAWDAAPEMTNSGNGTWTISNLTCSSALNCIIKNSSGQTGDILGIAVDKADIYIEIPAQGDPVVTYGSAAAPTQDPDAGLTKVTVDVYVELDDAITWDTVNFHHWNTGLQGTPGWPGITLAEEDGMYVGEIEVEESVTAISGIVNGGGEQTGDITGISVETGVIYIKVASDFTVTVDDELPSTNAGTNPTTAANDTTTAANDTTTAANTTTTAANGEPTSANSGGNNNSNVNDNSSGRTAAIALVCVAVMLAASVAIIAAKKKVTE